MIRPSSGWNTASCAFCARTNVLFISRRFGFHIPEGKRGKFFCTYINEGRLAAHPFFLSYSHALTHSLFLLYLSLSLYPIHRSKTIMTPPASDPSVYQAHHDAFAAEGLPTTTAGWIVRAQKVAEILAPDAAPRNKEQKVPHAELSLLKSSGLTKVMGAPKYGGGGQTWETAFRVVRELAVGDG